MHDRSEKFYILQRIYYKLFLDLFDNKQKDSSTKIIIYCLSDCLLFRIRPKFMKHMQQCTSHKTVVWNGVW